MKPRLLRGGLTVAAAAVALLGAARGSALAMDVIIQPGAPSLAGNILLSGSDALKIVGGGTPWTLDAQGFGIATAPDWVGTMTIADCNIANLGTSMTLAIDVHAGAGASVDIQRTSFATSGGISIQATGDIVFTFSNNTIQADSIVALTGSGAQPAFRYSGVAGGSAKLFQGNRVLRSWVQIQNGGAWLVGGASAAEGNLVVGPGAGLRIDTRGAPGTVVRGNYVHAVLASDGSGSGAALDALGDGTLVVEHNVLRGGSGVVGTFSGGELRYNLLGDPASGSWVVIGSDAAAQVHHNVFIRNTTSSQKVAGVDVIPPATNPTSSVYNNTMDGGGTCYGTTSRAIAVDENAFLPSLRNNAIFGFPSDDGAANTALVGPGRTVAGALGMKGDPGPARLGYADFNLFYNLKAATMDNYGLSEVLGPGVSGECELKDGLHIAEDHFIVEVVDPETGACLSDGAQGELVITTLTREAMPVVRFRTGDLSVVTREPCECGRLNARMAKVLGRTDDMLIIRGVNVYPSQIEKALLEVDGVEPHFVIVVDRKGELDNLEVWVEASEEVFSDDTRDIKAFRHKVEEHLKSKLNVRATVSLKEPRTLERTPGKAKHVVDRRDL